MWAGSVADTGKKKNTHRDGVKTQEEIK
jgi:hypothetical protein